VGAVTEVVSLVLVLGAAAFASMAGVQVFDVVVVVVVLGAVEGTGVTVEGCLAGVCTGVAGALTGGAATLGARGGGGVVLCAAALAP
jgi:hypothetical protein